MNPKWWKVQFRDYVWAEHTDITNTWRRFGWKPQSELKDFTGQLRPYSEESYSDSQLASIRLAKHIFLGNSQH